MAIRIYIVPENAAIDDDRPTGGFRPKYISWRVENGDPADFIVAWGGPYYGLERTAWIVGAEVDAAQHAQLAVQPDVLALPTNLDNTPNAAVVASAQTQLEAWNVPAQWITTSTTYRQIARTIFGMFQFAQAMNGFSARVVLPEISELNARSVNLGNGQMTWASLDQEERDELTTLASSLGVTLNPADGDLATSIRNDLKGRIGTIFRRGGISKDAQLNAIPAKVRRHLRMIARAYRMDTSQLTGTTTVREAYKLLADQWGPREVRLGGLLI